MNRYTADNKNARTLGRTVFRNNVLWLGYSCTAAEFIFTGKSLSAAITTDWTPDEEWKEIFRPYLAVFIGNEDKPRKRFPLSEGENTYEIFSSDEVVTVKIRIMKLSENAFSKAGIVSLICDGEITPSEAPAGAKRMEFIGDSITCGFGIEAEKGDNFSTATENPWENYASLTARHFGAEYRLVSWSGIGILSNSIPDEADEPSTDWLMPHIYPYTDKSTEGFLGISDGEKEIWDFGKYPADIIVINLGTNDNYYTRKKPEREDAFGKACLEFIKTVREYNPHSYIIYALGVMGQELCAQAENAVKALNDEKISFVMFDVQNEEDGIGAEGHPNLLTHKRMAETLIKFIEKI